MKTSTFKCSRCGGEFTITAKNDSVEAVEAHDFVAAEIARGDTPCTACELYIEFMNPQAGPPGILVLMAPP